MELHLPVEYFKKFEQKKRNHSGDPKRHRTTGMVERTVQALKSFKKRLKNQAQSLQPVVTAMQKFFHTTFGKVSFDSNYTVDGTKFKKLMLYSVKKART